MLRSKFLTIELLKIMFGHRHEVIRFLRSFSRGSIYFLEQYYELDIEPYFSVCEISIRIPLNHNVCQAAEFEATKEKIMRKLTAFTKLQNVEAYKEAFKISIEVVIDSYYRGRSTIIDDAVVTCLKIVKEHMDEFERVRFTANEDSLGNFGGIESDHISHFFEQFVNNFEDGEKISVK